MHRYERAGDLTTLWLSSWRSRLVGYGVYLFLWRGVLIDSGFPGAAASVRRFVRELRPRGAIVTHGHEDHAGNADLLAGAGMPIWHSPLTPPVMRDSLRLAAYRRLTWGRPRAASIKAEPFVPEPLQVLHMPGHSVDHHVVWDPEREVLFAADLFLGVKVRVARPEERPRALVTSLRATAELKPRAMWDAHRGAIADPVAALLAKAEWLEALIGRVERRMQRGEPDEHIAREELGRPAVLDVVSFGDLSRVALVRAIRRDLTPAA